MIIILYIVLVLIYCAFLCVECLILIPNMQLDSFANSVYSAFTMVAIS